MTSPHFRNLMMLAAAVGLFLAAGCSDDDTKSDGGVVDGPIAPGDGSMDLGSATDSGTSDDLIPGCVFDPGPADKERVVVVSRPYGEGFGQADDYEALHLSADGVLSRPNIVFTMRRLYDGEILFSADGRFGYSAQGDGSIGIFRVESDRSITVLDRGFDPGFYVSKIVIGPDGRRLFALNSQWRENGGGIYQLEMACDGSLTSLGLLAAAKLPYDLAFLPGDKALVAGRDVLDSTPGHDLHLLSLAATPTATPGTSVLAGVDAFGDDDNSVSDMTITGDGRYALLADTALQAGNRIAVVDLGQGGAAPTAVQLLSYGDPNAVLMSPFDNAAVVLGTEANRITVLDYAPGTAQPFAERGKLVSSSSTLLPTNGALIRRGTLEGRFFVSENVTLRQVRFFSDGRVEEVEALDFGEGGPAICGGVGVQP